MRRTVALCLAAFAVGAVAGYSAFRTHTTSRPPPVLRAKGHRFIHPLLDYPDVDGFIDVNPAKMIAALTDKAIRSKNATQVSVYFRDLDNGPWFGVRMDEKFSPASLLKVPILIAVLRQAEAQPGLLGLKMQYVPAGVTNVQTIVSKSALKLGQWYTVDEFLRAMIEHSDNNAAFALLTRVDPKRLEDLYRELRVNAPDRMRIDDWLTVREYSAFFRILYNASYLNKGMSEKALELLATARFRDALVAGVPAATPVAHKFGERRLEGGMWQLHDCGVVYYPQQPYLLCVMTRGPNMTRLAEVIRDISKEVYREVDMQYRAKK